MNNQTNGNQDHPQTAPKRKRPGAPKGNQNGRRHGLYSKLHPVDYVDTLERLRREQGLPPLDPKTAARLAAITRHPRMSPRLLAETVNAMRVMLIFERAIKRLSLLKS